jgi:3-hydroxybutyryl-CoA dehydrogenase
MQVTPVQAIIASNTSSISITRLAAVTSKPHRVVGAHFMHPVWDVPIVELAKGMHTSNGVYQVRDSQLTHLCRDDDAEARRARGSSGH